MNTLKNFEAIFIVALGLAFGANVALDSTVKTPLQPQAGNLQVVVVSAKRLTDAQKKQSLLEERQAERHTTLASDATAVSKI